jgi:hypothetical protein
MMKACESTPANLVRAVFEDTACSFDLPKDATMAELVEELTTLISRYGRPPLYVAVRLRS